eukprot:c21755_g1_i1.p1 GENE.c21755_g1_i1~~c21755_g1_i1.p1  ORF type:complete len:153 (+),score=67.56 c21755_g1_i1:20-478(+)
MVLTRDVVGLIFTSEEDVIASVSHLITILALFHICDGLQVCGGGIFRAMGKHYLVAGLNFIGFWLLGIGVGILLTFQLEWGLPGLWWGIASGVFFTTILSLILLYNINWRKEATKAHENAAHNRIIDDQKRDETGVEEGEMLKEFRMAVNIN